MYRTQSVFILIKSIEYNYKVDQSIYRFDP